MFSVEFSINILFLALAILASGFVGYSLRTRQLRKKNFKIVELRKEMVDNHAHILELQKEYVELEARFMESKKQVHTIRASTNGFENRDLEVLDSAI
jgi:hypothetical protein